MTKAEIIQIVDGVMFTSVVPLSEVEAALAARGALCTGIFSPPYEVNPILRGCPTFDTFAGPSAGRAGCVRYEDRESNRLLSW